MLRLMSVKTLATELFENISDPQVILGSTVNKSCPSISLKII